MATSTTSGSSSATIQKTIRRPRDWLAEPVSLAAGASVDLRFALLFLPTSRDLSVKRIGLAPLRMPGRRV